MKEIQATDEEKKAIDDILHVGALTAAKRIVDLLHDKIVEMEDSDGHCADGLRDAIEVIESMDFYPGHEPFPRKAVGAP